MSWFPDGKPAARNARKKTHASRDSLSKSRTRWRIPRSRRRQEEGGSALLQEPHKGSGIAMACGREEVGDGAISA